jgi:hypothetical protein
VVSQSTVGVQPAATKVAVGKVVAALAKTVKPAKPAAKR